MDLAWLSIIALLGVVAVSCTARGNPGVVALALAWVLAVYVAPSYGQTLGTRALWAGFPAELFLTLVGVSLLFALAEVNGTLLRVARATQALCRGNRGVLPIAFSMLCFVLGTLGPGNIAVAGLVAPVAMATATRAGIPPLLMAIMVGHGSVACTLSPLTAGGIVANQILSNIGLGGHEWQIYWYNAAANIAVGLSGYLLLGGWRLFGQPDPGSISGEDAAIAMRAAPEDDGPLTRQHVITLLVVAAVVAIVVFGRAHIGMVAFTGAMLLVLLGLADERSAFQKVPWSVIVMVCGVSVLTALLERTGGTERFASMISAVSSAATLSGITAFATGLISVYSSTTGVVLPAFLPMVKNLAQANPEVNGLDLASSVVIGGTLVDISPLSTIGALCLAAALDTDRRALFNRLLAYGLGMSVVAGALCWAIFGH